MKPVSLTLIASAVSVLLSAGMASAQAQSVSAKMSESPNLWFVEFAGAPTADGRRLDSVKADEAQFLNEASNLNIKFKKHNTFTHLFNGVSIEVSPQERARLAKMKSVKAMYPVMVIDAPKVEKTDGGSAADMATALGMTGADIVQNTLGYTGAGIKVGVIDTGIDLDHPAFGGGGVPGGTPFAGHPRVKYGYDFVGDAFQAGGVPQPDANPDDCAGHGTHVAGIIGGNTGTFKGVAPDVTFGAYRVFGCTGSTTSDIILAAMERAKADGMQVINQSLGASYQWPQYPTAQAADRLVRDGIVVVASIGNCGVASTSCGAGGLYGAGAPGVGANVIGVASYENVGLRLQSLTAGSDGKAFGFQDATGAAATPTTGTFPLARTGSVTKVDDACTALPAGSLTGKVALIRRGTCSFYIKASNAQAAGAAGVILYNNVPGFLGATVAGTPAITIPVVATSDQQGAELDARAATGSETITWTSNIASFNNPLGGLISSFSSWGLAADLSLKPDVGAPGGMIYSSYPLEGGGWATLSGTSMSSPHTAGAVALFLQARPGTPAATVRDRFQNAADPKMWQGNPGLGMLDATHRQGAGMIDIPQTIQAKTFITPGKLSLGESQAGPATRTLTVRNPSRTPVTYTISHVGAAATGANSFTVSTYNIAATAAFSTTSLTVPANGSASVDVTVTAPAALPDKGIYGGYVVFTNTTDNSTWRVPYSGFKGDYQAIQVLAPTANGFPWLAKLVGTSYQKQPTGASYTLQSGDVPYFLVHFDHHARTFRMKVRDAVSGKTWWDAAKDDYIPRQSTATGFYAFNWDGTTRRPNGDLVTVPNGDYIIDVMVLKALGDANNDADWEVWASPKVTLARPAPTN